MNYTFDKWSSHLVSFYRNLEPPASLPDGIDWLHPQKDEAVLQIVEQFFHKFYNDDESRTLLLGINPGRFGAGVTGINFTGPRQLSNNCKMEHRFGSGSELSAEFIYEMIEAYGGALSFYKKFFIGAVSPLGFVKEGKNLNYYDDKELAITIAPFIVSNIRKLLEGPVNREVCFCIGGEKNFKYLSRLNEQEEWFGEIVPLAHPRFIMQYRRKQKDQFVLDYLRLLSK